MELQVSKLKEEIMDKLRIKQHKESISYFLSRLPGRVVCLLLSRDFQAHRSWPADDGLVSNGHLPYI